MPHTRKNTPSPTTTDPRPRATPHIIQTPTPKPFAAARPTAASEKKKREPYRPPEDTKVTETLDA